MYANGYIKLKRYQFKREIKRKDVDFLNISPAYFSDLKYLGSKNSKLTEKNKIYKELKERDLLDYLIEV